MNTRPSELEEAVARLKHGGRAHLLGIGGVGMSGLALLLRARGCRVSGCDASPGVFAGRLAAAGIEVHAGHDPAHLGEADWCVYSTAVGLDNPELAAARARGLPLCRRGAVLAALAGERPSIAVSGTHGKSTTSAMIAQALEACGRSPDFCIGAEVEALDGTARAGAGQTLVVEADESDGSVALYACDTAVITNVEYDHMEHFADRQGFEACLAAFGRRARRRVLYCADDPASVRLFQGHPKALSFGLHPRADLRGEMLDMSAQHMLLRVLRAGEDWGVLRLPVAGAHNARDALACVGACVEEGCRPRDVLNALARFRPARRRFETAYQGAGLRVISDYAHHPTEIRAVMDVARRLNARRLLAVFQPHRYTRTLALRDDFPPAFEGLDRLVLTPVYAASEPPLRGGTSADLMDAFRARSPVPTELASSLEEAWERLRKTLLPGDTLLVIGAGDVEKIARWAREEGRAAEHAP